MELNNALIMGAIYDPDTDCQYVLMRVSSKDWDRYQQGLDLIKDDLPEVQVIGDGSTQHIRLGARPKIKIQKPTLKRIKGNKKVWEIKTKPPHGIFVPRDKKKPSQTTGENKNEKR